ncbi:MAG: hypothetical protein ABI599_15480 [Flavobacteriales bacterium]
MRNSLFTVFMASALLVACNKTKPVVAEPVAPASLATPDFHTGVVTTAQAKGGCPFLVIMDSGEGNKALIPIGLDEKYLKDGLKLSFKFRPSRASSGGCLTGRPAILEEVSVVK